MGATSPESKSRTHSADHPSRPLHHRNRSAGDHLRLDGSHPGGDTDQEPRRGLPIIAGFPADLAQDERRLEFRPPEVASVVGAPSLPIPESRVQRSGLDVPDRSRLDVDQTVPRPDPPRADERAEARDDPRSTPFRSRDQGERGCLRLREQCGLVSKPASRTGPQSPNWSDGLHPRAAASRP